VLADRWQRVEELFAGALAQPEASRLAYLEVEESDPTVRSEVERLLAVDAWADEDGRFELAIARQAAELEVERESRWLGRRVGRWQLLEALGQGGMGLVFRAEAVGPEGPEQAALKLLPRSLASPDLADRFLAEQRILAQLDHPGIARFLEAGSSAEGLLYLAMEPVDGLAIDRYCDGRQLSTRERIALVLQVCEAVAYAHRNLVVHRDLKPSHVLVTSDGRVKLLDFGIAKLLQVEPSAHGAPTVTANRWLTPAYASPEQLQGKAVTTVADVFSLGVLLYELLTGCRPFRAPAAGEDPSSSARLGGGPPRASAVVLAESAEAVGDAEGRARERSTTPAQLARRLAGDLDVVLAKALALEPERRYSSVVELAADLERHLAGLPVTARPDTLSYRVGKFLRRHRLGVSVISVGAALTLVALGTITVLLAETRQQRDRAERGVAALTEIFAIAEPDPERGESITARELLDRSAERVRSTLAAQPAMQGELLGTLAGLYERLFLYERAEQTLQEALALAVQEGRDRTIVHAERLNHLGRVLAQAGRFPEAERYFREALALREELLTESDPAVAGSYNNVGLVALDLGRFVEAERDLRRALELDQRFRPGQPAVASVQANLALLYTDLGRLEEAEPLYRDALTIYRAAGRERDESAAYAADDLAMNLLAQGEVAEARELAEESLATRLRLLGAEHRDTARGLCRLGAIQRAQGELEAARGNLERSLALREKLLGLHHAETAESLAELAALAVAEGRRSEGEAAWRRAIEAYERAMSPSYPGLARPLLGLAELSAERGDCAGARELLERRQGVLPPGYREVAGAGPGRVLRQCPPP
jgi:eukaryotic-like serine/threonine-protein kinase